MFQNIDPGMSFVVFVLVMSIGQTLFASLQLLLARGGDPVANRIMALFMMVTCLVLAIFYVYEYWMVFFPNVLLLHIPIIYFLPPLLWLYVARLTSADKALSFKGVSVHFLPCLVAVLLMAPFFSLPGIEKLEWFAFPMPILASIIDISDIQRWMGMIYYPIRFGAVVVGFTYFVKAHFLLVKHRETVENEFSNIEAVSLNWLRYLVWTYIAIYFFFLLAVLGGIWQLQLPYVLMSMAVLGAILLSIFGFFGISQVRIYYPEQGPSSDVGGDSAYAAGAADKGGETTEKYKYSPLSESQIEGICRDLESFLRSSKLYLDADLKIGELAAQLQLPSRDVSRVINGVKKQNFLEFINAYRIAEAKEMLVSSDNTVLDIAMQAGFNSKSAFYTAFKKVAGMTPTEFRQSSGAEAVH